MNIEIHVDIDALEHLWKFFQTNGFERTKAVRRRWTYQQERSDQVKVHIPYALFVILKENEAEVED